MKVIIAGDEHFLEEMDTLPLEVIFIARQPADLHRSLFQGGYDEVFIGFEPDVSLTVLENIKGTKNVAVVFDNIDQFKNYGETVFKLGGVPILLEDLKGRFTKSEAQKKISVPSKIVEQEIKKREEKSPIATDGAPKIIAVFAPKGGVGKTTISAYLAAHMAMSGKKIVAVDVDNVKVGADLGRRFGFFVKRDGTNYRNIIDFSNFPDNQYHQWELVEKYIVRTDSFPNLSLVLNPPRPADLGYDFKLVDKAVSILRYHFDHVILDLSPLPSQLNVEIFTQLADKVFFLTTPDPGVIDGARTFLDAISKYDINLTSFHLIINMFDSKHDKNANKIAHHVGLPLRGNVSVFPYDSMFREKRIEMALITPKILNKSNFSRQMDRLVKEHVFQEKQTIEKRRTGFFALPFFAKKKG